MEKLKAEFHLFSRLKSHHVETDLSGWQIIALGRLCSPV